MSSSTGPHQERRLGMMQLVGIVFVAAILHFGYEIFLPLAIATLLTFALGPIVSRLRKLGLPQIAAVILTVLITFLCIGAFSFFVAMQLADLAENMPVFQDNIISKVERFSAESGDESGFMAGVADMLARINSQLDNALPAGEGAASMAAGMDGRPMPVEVIERRGAIETVIGLVVPLVSPVAQSGLVIVLVIFMLLEKSQLRDRAMRLLGGQDVHRSTELLDEAGGRVAQYLLTQLIVNVIYALPIGIGLWIIGVPNAPLWGMLTLVLRFVPYIGSALSAALPLFLAFAASADWSMVLWTAALFLTIELITSNVVEPWLYGSRTGVSPLAVIISAIVWTWIWGPLGLVLSTPMTVVLVVLGRHIPAFQIFDILFGDEPPLAPHSRLYQRLLTGNAIEAVTEADDALEDDYLSDYYQSTAVPALILAEHDIERGVLKPEGMQKLLDTIDRMLDGMQEEIADEMEEAEGEARAMAEAEGIAVSEARESHFLGEGYSVLSIGGRTALDDRAARMLAQALASEGAITRAQDSSVLASARFEQLAAEGRDCIVLNYLDNAPPRASLLIVKRLKRAFPKIRIGVVIWDLPPAVEQGSEGLGRLPVTGQLVRDVEEIGADFVVTAMQPLLEQLFQKVEPKVVEASKPARKVVRRVS